MSFLPCVCAQLLQSCLTLCNPMDCSPPSSSVYGKNTGVGCHCLLCGIFPNQRSKLCLLWLLNFRCILYHWATREAPFFFTGDWKCKSRKSRDMWSYRQVWPWNTKRSSAKANRVLPQEHTGQSKHPLPTTRETTLYMDITRWSIPKSDWFYSL